MLSYFDIFDIFDIFRVGLPGGESYSPAMWFNNMGLSNKTAVNTRTSTGTVFDPEGLAITTEPGEISIEGARRERNLQPSSEDFEAATWSGSDASIAVVAGQYVATAEGSYKAAKDTFDIGDATGRSFVCAWQIDASNILGSVRLQKIFRSPIDDIGFDVIDLSSYGLVTISTLVTGSTLSSTQIENRLTIEATGESCVLIHSAVFEVTGRTNKAPPEYIDSETDYGYGVPGVKYYDTTNGNTVVDNIVTEAPGHKFVVDGGRKEQNDMFSQQDISKWAATAGVTTVQNADGSWRVTLPAGGTISTASDLANPSVTYDAGRELVTAVAMKLT